MREIKFRAWDASGKSMIPANSICRIHFSKGLPYCILKWDGNILIRGEVNLMQYTGLKDKNGKEIYEGDILSYILKEGWEIFFEEGIYYMMCDNDSYLLEKMRAMISEIIGNIYENPEILKSKKEAK